MSVARNAALEARILENWNDPGPYLVYADWLLSQGDPRGELILIQHALRHELAAGRKPFARVVEPPSGKQAPPLPNKAELIARERQLADEYLPEWIGSWHARLGPYFKLRWRCGFIESATFVVSKDGRIGLPFREVREFLALPAAAMARSVSMRVAESERMARRRRSARPRLNR